MNRQYHALFLTLIGAAAVAGCSQEPVMPPKDAWFQSQVVSEPKLVLVDFNAEWCGPCKMLKPSLEKLAEAHGDKVKVVPIDVDERAPLAAHYDVEGIPRLMLFKKGHVIAAETGVMPYDELEAWVLSHVE
jgi:thioredoxin 1